MLLFGWVLALAACPWTVAAACDGGSCVEGRDETSMLQVKTVMQKGDNRANINPARHEEVPHIKGDKHDGDSITDGVLGDHRIKGKKSTSSLLDTVLGAFPCEKDMCHPDIDVDTGHSFWRELGEGRLDKRVLKHSELPKERCVNIYYNNMYKDSDSAGNHFDNARWEKPLEQMRTIHEAKTDAQSEQQRHEADPNFSAPRTTYSVELCERAFRRSDDAIVWQPCSCMRHDNVDIEAFKHVSAVSPEAAAWARKKVAAAASPQEAAAQAVARADQVLNRGAE